jgi:hypothetical protein
MKRKIVGIFVCTLLIATAIPLTLATNENEPKNTPWKMSGFNSDISMSGTADFTCYFRLRNNPSTNMCSSRWIWIKYGANGEISTPEGNHDGRFAALIYRYKGFRDHNETEQTLTFDGKVMFYFAREIV